MGIFILPKNQVSSHNPNSSMVIGRAKVRIMVMMGMLENMNNKKVEPLLLWHEEV